MGATTVSGFCHSIAKVAILLTLMLETGCATQMNAARQYEKEAARQREAEVKEVTKPAPVTKPATDHKKATPWPLRFCDLTTGKGEIVLQKSDGTTKRFPIRCEIAI